ncbi:hypothetical protein ACLB2K_052303 [Fragaria x ananassa]
MLILSLVPMIKICTSHLSHLCRWWMDMRLAKKLSFSRHVDGMLLLVIGIARLRLYCNVIDHVGDEVNKQFLNGYSL